MLNLKYLRHFPNFLDQKINFLFAGIDIEAGPRHRHFLKSLDDRRPAMLARPNGNAVFIQNLGRVMGMYPLNIEGQHPASFLGTSWSIDRYQSFFLQLSHLPQSVADQFLLVFADILQPQITPLPVGPSILCPEKAMKSAPSLATSVFICGTNCAPSITNFACGAFFFIKAEISASGVIVPKTLLTAVTATNFTLSSKR